MEYVFRSLATPICALPLNLTWQHLRPDSRTAKSEESMQMGTRVTSGSEETRLQNRFMQETYRITPLHYTNISLKNDLYLLIYCSIIDIIINDKWQIMITQLHNNCSDRLLRPASRRPCWYPVSVRRSPPAAWPLPALCRTCPPYRVPCSIAWE